MRVQKYNFISTLLLILLILYVLTHFLGVCVINFWCRLSLFHYIFCTNSTLHTVHSHVRWKSCGVSFSAMSVSQCFEECYMRTIHLVFVAFCRLLSPHQSSIFSSATTSWFEWITANSTQRGPAVFVMSASLRWLNGECQAYPKLPSCIYFFLHNEMLIKCDMFQRDSLCIFYNIADAE